ncbi:MAG: VCBS repeat-containing protein, partial [Acidobacteriota bacterium]|nr:VCBS repeat-containing protein [Acidobacteriota bacterium]
MGLIFLAPGFTRPSMRGESAARRLNSAAQAGQAKSAPPLTAGEIQSLRSLGKAYYEQGIYKESVDAFGKVVASGRAVALDHLDLAQGLIQTNQLNRALEELNTAEEMAPSNLAIRYNLGILYKHELRYTDAERELKRVIASDPDDPPTWFNLGDVYFAEHKLEPAFEAFRRVVNMGYAKAQNFYVAATFHCFIILNRLKQPTEARNYLKLNMASRNKVPNISLQYPALEAGKYGAVNIAPATLTMPGPVPSSAAITFKDITQRLGVQLPSVRPLSPHVYETIQGSEYSLGWAKRNLVPLFGGSVIAGDYEGNGKQDLFVVVPGGTNHLLRNNGDGTFTDVTAKAGVGGHGGSLAAAFVDYNNSGHPSLVAVGLGGVTLYKNNGNGTFTNVTAAAGLKGNPGELDTGIAAFDVDNDGFVDLVVTVYTDLSKPPNKSEFAFPRDFPDAVSHLYRNNGDGTFSDITTAAGLASARGHMRGAVFADFSNDGYIDLLFLRDGGSPLLFMNQGQDKFIDRTAQAGDALAHSLADEAAVSDFNHDGKFDLVLWSRDGYQVLLNQGGGRFKPVTGMPNVRHSSSLFGRRGAVADLNGDSFDDLLVKGSDGAWTAIENDTGQFESSRNLEGLRAASSGASLR